MESKTKHRVLGVVVIAGLAVILLPFFQGGKDGATNSAALTAPPFPDQSIKINDNSPIVDKPADQAPDTQPQISNAPQSLPIVQKTANEIVSQQPDEAINTSHSSKEVSDEPVISNPAATPNMPVEKSQSAIQPALAIGATELASPTSKIEKVESPENPSPLTNASPMINPISKIKHATKSTSKKELLASAKRKLAKRSSYVHLPIDNNGLANIHHSVWVIQVGSYRNKKHALREVNRLRANGYRAFIQQVSTTLGSSTQVFIGPESKQPQARAIARDLLNDMHIKGIVISYKPLAS